MEIHQVLVPKILGVIFQNQKEYFCQNYVLDHLHSYFFHG